MTWQEALETVVQRTSHERYHWLCSDENPDVESRGGYRALMIAQASGQPEAPPMPRPAIQAQLQLFREARECPYRVPPACSCPTTPATCRAGRGPSHDPFRASLTDCADCLSARKTHAQQ